MTKVMKENKSAGSKGFSQDIRTKAFSIPVLPD